jgi:hypothetical protein
MMDILVLGPEELCKGDLIVILCGSSVPYDLRRLVRKLYCDGTMHGEAFVNRDIQILNLVS